MQETLDRYSTDTKPIKHSLCDISYEIRSDINNDPNAILEKNSTPLSFDAAEMKFKIHSIDMGLVGEYTIFVDAYIGT